MNLQRIAVGALLMLLPVIVVSAVKSSDWGPILSSPATRQKGAPNAKVVVVEYSDFQCPSCAYVQPALHDFMQKYGDRVKFAYKYYPLKIHKNALPAAHAAECAAAQQKFWPYHDQLFATQAQWAPLANPATNFMAIAETAKLDLNRFTTCLSDDSKRKVIEADAEEARDHQVQYTPTFFIGNRRLVGNGFVADGPRVIEEELRK